MRAFYNEIDTYCCDWLSNLMDAGHITPGVICDKSIEDVFPDELRGFDRCHFFAGIGVWDSALNLAGWGERPVWTGSAPCQPFSAAGKGLGFADERHLWPAWFHLMRCGKPTTVPVFGEQVASRNARRWLDLVLADLHGINHAVGVSDLRARRFGSPLRRPRLYFVAIPNRHRRARRPQSDVWTIKSGEQASRRRDLGGRSAHARTASIAMVGTDGKRRILEPGIEPLVDGYPGLLERLRAYGNAINREAAAAFIAAADEAMTIQS